MTQNPVHTLLTNKTRVCAHVCVRTCVWPEASATCLSSTVSTQCTVEPLAANIAMAYRQIWARHIWGSKILRMSSIIFGHMAMSFN